ncbi:AI-2E family transporter [Mycolicibacterium peregrinum]|uniref:AI-2E family transporter n=1 Tax=Mycolicibacterium peregrinum TaxID=43304 RepID=UPI003AAB19C8
MRSSPKSADTCWATSWCRSRQAVLTFIWLMVFDVPYPLLLAVLVAVLDLIPIVGSTLAGIIVALVALTVSVPVSLATVVFFIALRLVEDYLLVPRIIGRTVEVPPLVTVVAVMLGGALLGIVGAILAIPIAAAILLLARETLFPQLDRR